MKRMILILLLTFLLLPRTAFAMPQELLQEMPQEVQTLWETAEQDNLQDVWHNGIQQLWGRILHFFSTEWRTSLRSVALVLLTAVLCAMAESCYQSTDSGVPNFVPLAGTLAVTGIVGGDVQTMIALGKETISQIHVLSEALLPTLSAAVSASGGIASASVRQVATVLVCDILISLIENLLLPLLNVLMIIAAADAVLPGEQLGKATALIRKCVTWLLTGTLALFTGYLTISGAAAGAADNLTAKMTRSTISAAVPVVGGIISEATGSVLAGAALLKSSIGILGMLAVLSVCLTPFLALAIQYLLYKIAALFAGVFGNTVTGYIQELSCVFGLLLGMAGSCALVLLISICSSISVVIA